MSRKRARPEPSHVAVTARCEHADLDPRVVVVDPTFAATLTTRHERRFEVTLEHNDAGPEQFTRDVPNVGEAVLVDLDDNGLTTPGSPVRPGTILVGKVTPYAGGPLSPEEKLLHAIFGEKADSVRDTSLRAPARCFGTVHSASVEGERAEVTVAWERPLEVGDVLLVDDAPLVVAQLRPLDTDLVYAGAGDDVSVARGAMARDALMARSIGPYDLLHQQPHRDADRHGGQVVSAQAIAALTGAAPWAAWEMLTLKSDSVGGRTRLYEALVKGGRPDVAPRTSAPPPVPATTSPTHDIFSFFERPPAPNPGEAPALQPEVVSMISRHLRALGLDVDLRSHAVGAVFLSPAQIHETSRGEVRSADDLASQRIFGPIKDYTCECGKYSRMRHRGTVCEDCGVEVISSITRRERFGHIELATPCVHPLLSAAPRHRRGRVRDEPRVGGHEPLHTIVVLPPALRGPAIDAAYTRVLTADADALQAAVDDLFAQIADIVDTTLHPRMYAKAVDYSAAAQLVVDPSVSPGECRVPRSLLLELFKPTIYGLLEIHGYATTIKGGKKMVEDERPEALMVMAEASEGYPVLLIAGKVIVARRVTAWDAPAIAVDPATADLLGARVVALHVPVTYEAAIEVADLADHPRAPSTPSDGWLARARRDGQLVDAAVRAAAAQTSDAIDDPVVHLALGRPPAPLDESTLERWQAAEEARQQRLHDQLAPGLAATPSPTSALLDRLIDDFELSVRTANGLANLGLVTVRDLCARSEADLLGNQHLGRKSLKEINEILHGLGLSLRPEG